STQPADGFESLPTTRRRETGRDAARPRHVRQRRRARSSLAQRAPEISGRGVAADSGEDSAAGADGQGAPQASPGEALMAVIEARGIRKAFGTTVALDGVDLRVEEGRIVGLI